MRQMDIAGLLLNEASPPGGGEAINLNPRMYKLVSDWER